MSGLSPRVTETRNHLMTVARECLLQGGGDFEVTEFARQANVSVGLAYHHFGSKSGLIAATLTRFFSEIEIALTQPQDEADSWVDDLYLRVRSAMEILVGDPLSAVVFGSMAASGEVADAERVWRRAIHESLVHKVRVGQMQGVVSRDLDPEIAAAVLNAGLFEVVAVAGRQEYPMDAQRVTDEFWVLMARALGLPQALQVRRRSDDGLVSAAPTA